MYAMQYTVTLPTDYDMRIIRDRVAVNGHRLDGFPGLRFKTSLIRERARGAPGNEYAPFYVWDDVDGMRAFLWGDPGYGSIVRDFGRQPVHDWTVAGVADGPAGPADARSLTLDAVPMLQGETPAEVVGDLTSRFLDNPGPDTVWRVAAVDVTSWTVVCVEVSAAPPRPATPGFRTYEVLHVSTGKGVRC